MHPVHTIFVFCCDFALINFTYIHTVAYDWSSVSNGVLKNMDECTSWFNYELFITTRQIWGIRWLRPPTGLVFLFKLDSNFILCIQTCVIVRKCSIQVKIGNFFTCVILKFDGWPWKAIGHLFYAILSFNLCASFRSHQSIQTRVTVRKRPIRVKIGNFGPM